MKTLVKKYPVFTFQKKYFVGFLLLLLTEVLIAVFIRDRFIRPYVGDFLVVVLIYCFVKTFLNTPVTVTPLSVLFFSYAVEALQYFHVVDCLRLRSGWARIVIGDSFAWTDILAYTLGIFTVLCVEKICRTHTLLYKNNH